MNTIENLNLRSYDDGDLDNDDDSHGVILLCTYLDVVQMVLTAHGVVEIWKKFHHRCLIVYWSSGDYSQ